MVLLLSLIIGGFVLLTVLAAWWHQRDRNPKVCDLRRCIVIVGDGQNDGDCINQRLSLKPHLIMVRDANINVIEIYGKSVPRRNGKALEWTDNKHLRRTLQSESGFHLMCIDDDGEMAMRVRMPVSEHVIAELISGSTHEALPSPDMANEPRPKEEDQPTDEPSKKEEGSATDSWSVGVLR